MAVRGPGGSLAAAGRPGGMTGGAPGSNSAGTHGDNQDKARKAAALAASMIHAPGGSVAASKAPGGMTGRTDLERNTGGNANQGKPGPQYDQTGRMVSDGTVPNVPDPSVGQFMGLAMHMAPFAGTANDVGGLLGDAADGDFSDTYDGGIVGSAFDKMRGVSPGKIEGSVPNHVAENTNTRGDRPSDGGDSDGSLEDRAAVGDSDSGLTGAAATDMLFSDVQMDDRRKYRPVGAGTAMAMGLA